jgi:hypothetical protein
MKYFELRGGFRNWLARLLLQAANRIATEQTLCSTKEEWQFKREWKAEPYPPVPGSKFCRPNSQ